MDEQLWNEGDRTPYPLNFEKLPGLKSEVKDTDSSLEIFELFLNDTDYENISQETNEYAKQFINSMTLKEKSCFHK